ncbi:hypothetical protein FRC17_006677 [Serendipita sp. 399]|nr:hypothetical protein FRC17_006677 [Serendipita sp. 399]
MDNLMDILGNSDVYDAFNINAVEFDYMLDYLREHDITPENIYSEIVDTILTTNDGWRPLLDRGLFPSVIDNPVPASDPLADPPRDNANAAEEQPASSTAQSPETAVELSAPEAGSDEINRTTDQEMRNSDEPVNDAPREEATALATTEATLTPAAETVTPATTQNEEVSVAQESLSVVAVESLDQSQESNPPPTNEGDSTQQPPTPIVVPERLPTPTIEHPEPTLDDLPIDVEPQEQPQQVSLEVASETPNQVEQQQSNPSDAPESSQQQQQQTQQTETSPPDDARSNSSSESDEENDSRSRERSSPPPENATSSYLNKICRKCAADVFFWGARDWWIKERAKAVASNELAEEVRKRKDCENIGACEREFDNAHAREFNHIPQPLHPITTTNEAPSSSNQAENAQDQTAPPETSNEADAGTNNPSTNSTDNAGGSHHSPERPSTPDTVRMEVEPTPTVVADSTNPAGSNESPSANVVTEATDVDHEMTTEDRAAADSNDFFLVSQTPGGTTEAPASAAAVAATLNAVSSIPNGNGYSEKIEAPIAPQDTDVQMTIPEESHTPTTAAPATPVA